MKDDAGALELEADDALALELDAVSREIYPSLAEIYREVYGRRETEAARVRRLAAMSRTDD